MKRLELPGLQLQGISVAGLETCLVVPGWKLAFDLGVCPRPAVHCSTVLLTHAHVDHLGAVATHCATRQLMGLPPARYIVPPEVVEPLEDLFAVWRRLDRSDFAGRVQALPPGEELTLGKRRVVRPFRTVHRVVSQGYVVYARNQKLLPEFEGRPSEELGALRREGVEIARALLEPELAFSGDTRIEGVLDAPDALRARCLVMEVSFLDERVSVPSAREMGHVHLDEVVQHADRFQCGALVISHLSARYKDAEADALLQEKLPQGLRERSRTLMTGWRGAAEGP